MFREIADRSNVQGRYVLRHPWRGAAMCPEARSYAAGLPRRFATEAATLANLTGWPIDEIRARMAATGQTASAWPLPPGDPPGPWWRAVWPDD